MYHMKATYTEFKYMEQLFMTGIVLDYRFYYFLICELILKKCKYNIIPGTSKS